MFAEKFTNLQSTSLQSLQKFTNINPCFYFNNYGISVWLNSLKLI